MEKLPVSEITNWSPATTSPDATIAEAAAVMRARDVGGLVVVVGGAPVGIVTERDVVRKVVADRRAPESTQVRDVMSTRLVTTRPNADVADVARTMAKRRIRRLPVIGGDGRIGVVTDRDLLALSPALFDMARDTTGRHHAKDVVRGDEEFEGRCEGCEVLSDALHLQAGELLCEDCLDARA